MQRPLVFPVSKARMENRVFKAAMTEILADPWDNAPNERLVALYQRWGSYGAGMLITGNVMVDRRYLEAPENVVVEGDKVDGWFCGEFT